MRKEPFSVNNFVHIYNRGNRKAAIIRDQRDRWRFLQMLYYFNTETSVDNPMQNVSKRLTSTVLKSDFNQFNQLVWPPDWPEQQPIVHILAFVLMENHFHILLKEIQEGGITKFMRKLGTGMTNYSNTKYQETGRLFQGAYKAKRIDTDEYLKYVSVYIQVKNALELYPEGALSGAIENIDNALDWAAQYPYCSLGDYIGNRKSPIIEKDILAEIFTSPSEYKEFALDCMVNMDLNAEIEDLIFEE